MSRTLRFFLFEKQLLYFVISFLEQFWGCYYGIEIIVLIAHFIVVSALGRQRGKKVTVSLWPVHSITNSRPAKLYNKNQANPPPPKLLKREFEGLEI